MVNITLLLEKVFGRFSPYYEFGIHFLARFFKKSIFSKKKIGLDLSLKIFIEKKSERFDQFLTLKNDFENHNFAIFEAIVTIECRSAKDISR
jgi:hypothetical protein